MNSRPESLESSVRSLTGFIVLFLVVNWVSSYSWEQRSPNLSPGSSWRNLSSENSRLTKEYRSVCHAHSDCRDNAYICRGGLCDCAFGYKLNEQTEMCVGDGKTCNLRNCEKDINEQTFAHNSPGNKWLWNACHLNLIKAIGAKCMYDNHCISRAYCKGQTICTCKLEYPVVSSDNWSCVENGSKAQSESSSLLRYAVAVCLFHLAGAGDLLSPGLV